MENTSNMSMADEQLLEAIRLIVREEIQDAMKALPQYRPASEPTRSGFDLRAIAQKMGLDIYPRDYRELIDKFKVSGNLPSTMKDSWQRFKDWSDTDTGRYAASFSHRAFLDLQADKRNKLKAEGK